MVRFDERTGEMAPRAGCVVVMGLGLGAGGVPRGGITRGMQRCGGCPRGGWGRAQEEALLSEMEVTGQAFEDMQEQNLRLLQQLREKDDANFKLMSERIKSTQVHKLLQEEKTALSEQANRLQSQVDAQNQVVRKLEEKERLLQNSLSTVEKELSLRQQAAEMHRRKAVESAQSAADLKLHLDKYLAQLKDAQVRGRSQCTRECAMARG